MRRMNGRDSDDVVDKWTSYTSSRSLWRGVTRKKGGVERGAENEAPCLRPEEDIKHSRSEQVVASMDPKKLYCTG